MLLVCWRLVFWYAFKTFTSLVSASKDCVSVNNTSFGALNTLLATSTRGGGILSLLFSYKAFMMPLLTVLNSPRIC